MLISINFAWRDIVEDKVNSTFVTLIHYAMFFLVVYLVNFSYLKLIGSSADHKAHFWIGTYRNVNAMSVVEGRMLVGMWNYISARFQSCSHSADYCTTTRVVVI